MSDQELRDMSSHIPGVANSEPTIRMVGGRPYLIPSTAYVAIGVDGEEARGEGIRIKPTESGDHLVLAVPRVSSVVDQFVPITSIGVLYHLVHRQKWEGVMVPHDTHTQAAERNQAPYDEYVQAVTFAKVTGVAEHPATGEPVSCAVLNVRMPQETYGGQLWWVIGGHNIPHNSGTVEDGVYKRSVSSLGGTLRNEGEEEALIVQDGNAAGTPFNPQNRPKGRKLQILGYGRSSDRVGKVHESTIVVVHLPKGLRLVVRDITESLGFIRVPLAEWMRFMWGQATTDDQNLIRQSITLGLEDELARVPKSERAERQALVDRQLTFFFGQRREGGERIGFHLTPHQNTPPIDRLSLRAAEERLRSWGLLPPDFQPSERRRSRLKH